MNALSLTPAPDTLHEPSFQRVSDADALRRLGPAWRQLLEHSAAPNPMSDPDWLLTWWDIYGGKRELCVGLFHDADRLVGLAPLCRRRYWHRPGIPFRRLEFLGSDVDENDGVCSEYLNLITLPGHEQRVGDAFARALHRNAFGAWDECVLTALDADQPMTRALAGALLHPGCTVETMSVTTAPFLTLPACWENHLQAVTKKKRRALRVALEDFQAWAGEDWNISVAQTPELLAQGMQTLINLHGRRWQSQNVAGAFAAPRFRAFHEHYARLLLDRDELLLLWLTVRGNPVAALYGFATNRKVYFYQCGRTPEAPSHLSLGTVLLILAIQEAIRRGLEEFDFLGGEAQYKSLFATGERRLCQLRTARRGLPEFTRTLARQTLGVVRAIGRSSASLLGRIRQHDPSH